MTAPDELPPRPPFSPRLWPAWTGLGLALLAARLPWLWQRAIGRGVGWLALHLAGTRRRAAQANIELCFPEQSPVDGSRYRTTVPRFIAYRPTNIFFIRPPFLRTVSGTRRF